MFFLPGTLVSARNRLWRVNRQENNILHVSSLDKIGENHKFYIPIENISLSKMTEPDIFKIGSPAMQKLLLDAYRFSMIHNSAPLLSLQKSRVIPMDYQLVPLLMAMRMPRVRLLIADDVGLGKTIEAGLIALELISRQQASNLLIICPANLQEQWKQAMEYFFHLDPVIISSKNAKLLGKELMPGTDPWEYFNYIITSIDYVKMPDKKNEILNKKWDIVIIDEAHQIAKPHQITEDQKIEMQRWDLGKRISRVAKHFILLTATPHNGYTDSFASLIDMLDISAVTGSAVTPFIDHNKARKYVCQRRRSDVQEWFNNTKNIFPDRNTKEILIGLTEQESQMFNAVLNYTTLINKSIEGITEKRITQIAGWTILHMHKRALSSPEALRRTLANRKRMLEFKLQKNILQGLNDDQISSEIARAIVLDEDTGERYTEEEAGIALEHSTFGSVEGIKAELNAIEETIKKAKKISPQNDSKLQKLLHEVLPELLAISPKVIIFTKYKDTLDYLVEQIKNYNPYINIFTIYGELSEGQRNEQFDGFKYADKAVMVATDCISEGINLQDMCSQIVHYELPWNPNRLEQRNGRIDRFGQRAKTVYIRTLVMDEPLDMAILDKLVRKSDNIRKDYGFSPPFFGDYDGILTFISKAKSKKKKADGQISLFDLIQVEEIPDKIDPLDDACIKKIKDESFYGQTDIKFWEVEKKLRETENQIGSKNTLINFVKNGLKIMDCVFKDNGDGTYYININKPTLLRGLKEGEFKVTFDPELALKNKNYELLELGHPLLRNLIDEIKLQAFNPNLPIYGRTSYKFVNGLERITSIVYVYTRFISQTKPPSIIEELVKVPIEVYEENQLDDSTVKFLEESRPEQGFVNEDDFSEDMKYLFSKPNFKKHINDVINKRLMEIISERKVFKKEMMDSLNSESDWLEGIDDVSLSSYDILAVFLYYPVRS